MTELLNDREKGGNNQIVLPHNFVPRHYQEDVFKAVVPAAFDWGWDPVPPAAKRAVLLWHRRAGKDKLSINLLLMLAMQDVGNYLYFSPEISQTRKIIWKGIDKDGFRFIDHIPHQLIRRKTEQDMMIELVNNSTIQLGGADAYDRNMGTNPKAIIFSEYSLMNPSAWNYYRPILVENEGTAIFIYTARGHNHGYDMAKVAQMRQKEANTNWYYSKLTVDDTYKDENKEHLVISRSDIDQEIEEGMPEEMVQQEFYCSFDAGQIGAYYIDQIAELRKADRIGDYPHDPRFPVTTAWDLGLADKTSIWFVQNIQGQRRIIDYEEDSGVPLDAWVKSVKEKPYNYHRHIGPPDLAHREYTTGITRLEFAQELGLNFEVLPKISIADGISAVRSFLPTCVFNEALTEDGLNALINYTKVYDEKAQTFRERPAHNWASHASDAFRYLATGWEDVIPFESGDMPKVIKSTGRPRDIGRQGRRNSGSGRRISRRYF
jgi:phage terminase large subunit